MRQDLSIAVVPSSKGIIASSLNQSALISSLQYCKYMRTYIHVSRYTTTLSKYKDCPGDGTIVVQGMLSHKVTMRMFY